MIKSKKEAIEDSLVYFKGDQLAAETFISKYAMTDSDGNCESTPDDMHHRMAKEYARIEAKYGEEHQLSEDEIYELFKGFKYIVPGGSVMNGLGNPTYKGSLSNCFVIGAPEDSYGSIMRMREEQVQLMKRRGGAGIDISKLRPEGTIVHNAALTSTGPVSFMNVYSELTREVALNNRRGALMISFLVTHPDIIQFIESKQDLTKITGANISIRSTDEFMNAVKDDSDFIHRWPTDLSVSEAVERIGLNINDLDYNVKYWASDGKTCVMKSKAKDVWKKFVHCAWNTAEPGIMYEDKHNDYSPDSVYEQYRGVTTNPCGEVRLERGNSCRLMHINLQSFVNEDLTFDYDKLEKVAYDNMRLCDDLVDLELEHVEKIIEHIKEGYNEQDNRVELELWQLVYNVGKSSRRAGCGATGLADAVAKTGTKLNSPEGFEMVHKIFRIKMLGELKSQIDLARERGKFEGQSFDKEYEVLPDGTLKGMNPFYQRMYEEYKHSNPEIFDGMERYGRRNVSWSTMAPVGTGAIMTQGTSGVEPLFTPYGKRRKKCMSKSDRVDYVDNVGEKFTIYETAHRPLLEWIMENCPDYDKTKTFDEQATDEKKEKWFKASPWYECTADMISPNDHVALQSVVQKYISHSISKCVVRDTLIDCEDGFYYMDEIQDVDKVKVDEFIDLNKDLKAKTHTGKYQKINKFYNNGEKDVYTITLTNGSQLTCTDNERFIIVNSNDEEGWKELSEIKIGDMIKIS